MRLSNAKIYLDGKFTTGGIDFDSRINEVGPSVTDGEDMHGAWIIPGLIDIHTHAAMGEDASDANPEGLKVMSDYYAKGGVTSFLPTTMTVSPEDISAAMKVIRDFKRPGSGAKVAGINMEGPFLSYEKRGAQNPDFLKAPDADLFFKVFEDSGKSIKLVTLACEEEGSKEFIERVKDACVISLGHTTAGYDQAKEAFGAGASHLTHLFNAMPSLLHRDPGVIAAGVEAGAYAEIIADGIHVHPSMVKLAHTLFGDHLVLISDSVRCAGMPDGEYTLGGQDIIKKDGVARLADSGSIAGSAIHLMEGLRNAVKFGIPLEEAIYAATMAPALAIGESETIGSLAPGKAADIVVTDENFNVKKVYVEGSPID